jgi:CelD/BcsL family acetyltransferase involved in cellulose biosynthesis
MDRFCGLRAEWDALWARTATRRVSQGFDWCLAGWRTTGAPRGRRLRIVVMRQGGRAVVIWPMTVGRRLLWRRAGPLGPESTDYDPVLVEDGPEAAERLRLAWRYVLRGCDADIVTIPFVRHETVMHRILAADGTRRATRTLPCPFVVWDRTTSWDAYWRARAPRLRRGIRRRRRRLAECGTVASEMVDDPAALPAVLDWAIAAKIDWLARKRLPNTFLPTPEYRAFLRDVGAHAAPAGRLIAFVLRLDGRPVAAKIATVNDTRCEILLTVFDPAYAAHGPGQLLLADALAWCAQRGLPCDFRLGAEAYKYDWATGDCAATTHHLAATPWGTLLLAAHAVRRRWRAARWRAT